MRQGIAKLTVKIAGLGTYLPARTVSNRELEEELGRPVGWIERATGVRERRRADRESSVEMAAQAARQALRNAAVEPDQVDLVLSASTSRRQLIPCTAAFVQREMRLPEGKSVCFDVDATCLSFLVALRIAAQFVAGGAYHRVLIVSSETTRQTLDFAEPESSALMGDAAAAAVVVPNAAGEGSAVWHSSFATYSSGVDLTRCEGGGTLHHPNDPNTTPEMNRFHMDGPAVYRMASRVLGPFLDAFFDQLGWDRTTVDAVVPHQASRPGVALLTRRCGFRPEQLVINLETRGNCVAASVPLALAEAVQAGRIRRGQRVVLIGTGAGLTLGALALTY
jgi:3-oxoacyl-[acyl-carrier-protein] synthase-3